MTARSAYAKSGVDVEAGEAAVQLMKARLMGGRLYRETGLGEFGSVIDIPQGLRRPVLVTSTDGVGTKTEIARRLGKFDTIGQDLVAMCADDVVCHGAQPAFFMDYVAVGHLDPDRIADIVGGIGDACDGIGCALVGGETAEHPGVMPHDAFDLAGFCIGFAERGELVDNSVARPGDTVLGLASSGLHSNGYSLIRALVDDGRLPLDLELLTPTRLYTTVVLDCVRQVRARAQRVGGLAHITGGGLTRNLPRALGIGLGVRVHPSAWPQPQIFERVARAAGLGGEEMRAIFNCGIGFAVVLEPRAADAALGFLRAAGMESWAIGEVVPMKDLDGQRYAEAS